MLAMGPWAQIDSIVARQTAACGMNVGATSAAILGLVARPMKFSGFSCPKPPSTTIGIVEMRIPGEPGTFLTLFTQVNSTTLGAGHNLGSRLLLDSDEINLLVRRQGQLQKLPQKPDNHIC